MVQINYIMNQQDKVIKVFIDLLNEGTTTSLDVKNELRDKYPSEHWTQDFISMIMIDYSYNNDNRILFTDNGLYREYSLVVKKVVNTEKYSFTTKKGIRIEADTWLDIVETARQLGDDIHWSNSKKKFFGLWELQDNHLMNIIRKETEGLSAKDYAKYMTESPYAKELYTRH